MLYNYLTIIAAASTLIGQCVALPAPAPAPKTNLEARFSRGRCGVHVVQYQKPNPSTDSYRYDVRFVDANGATQATAYGVNVPAGAVFKLQGSMPSPFLVISGPIDSTPVGFSYSGFGFDSNNPVCRVGKYDNGKRQMDCTFGC